MSMPMPKPWEGCRWQRGAGRRDAESVRWSNSGCICSDGYRDAARSEFAAVLEPRAETGLRGGVGEIGSSGRKIRRRGGLVLEVLPPSQPAGPDERCGEAVELFSQRFLREIVCLPVFATA